MIGDSSKLSGAFTDVAADAKTMAAKVDVQAGKVRQSFDKMGEGADASESKFMGMADVLDGLGGAFGLPTEQATGMMRAFGDLSGGFAILQPLVGGLGSKLGGMLKMLNPVNLATKAWAAAQWLLNAAMSANPIGLIVIAIAALAAGLIIAYKKSETFRDIVDGVFRAVRSVVESTIGAVLDVIKGVWNWVSDNWPLLLAILTGPIGLAVLAITKNWDTIKEAFTAVKDWISDRVDDVVGFVTGIPGRIGGVVSTMWDGITNAFTAVKNWISDRVDDVVGFVTGIAGRIAGAASTMWNAIETGITNAKNWVGDRVSDVVGFFTGLGERLATAAGDLFRFVRDKVTEAKNWVSGRVDDVVGFFTGLPGRLAEGAEAIKNALLRPFEIAFNLIADAWNLTVGKLRFEVPSWVPVIGGKGWDVPDIPKLDTGGIIKGPGFFAAGPVTEAVVPLRGRAGVGTTVVVNNYIAGSVMTERRIVDAVHEGLLAKKRRGGSLALT